MSVNHVRHLLGLAAVVVVPSSSTPCVALAQAAPAQELRAALIADLQTMRDKFLQLAEAFPQDKYSWRPMTGVRSVSEVLMLAAFAQGLLTLLGAASEAAGLDRYLKANTVKRRTHSLFRQGCYWYSALPNLPEKRLRPLMEAFGKIVTDHEVSRDVLGVI